MSAIIKPEFLSGNRGRKAQMSWREAVEYNSNSREEKGREFSKTIDAYGQSVNADQAIQYFGGDDAVYMNVIVAPSESMRQFLEEKHGGREEAQRGFALAIMDRTNARNGIVHIHDHGNDGWHFHLAYPEHRSQMFGEHGKLQAAVDREMELLRGEANRPILDWDAHEEFSSLKEQLAQIQVDQRELGNARYRELQASPESEKLQIRARFDERELALIGRRREVELKAAEARYQSRGMAGCSAHQVEVERIERRTLTAISRMEARSMKRDLKAERMESWRGFSKSGQAHKNVLAELKREEAQLLKRAGAEKDYAKDQADQRGELAAPSFQNQIAIIDSRLGGDLADLRFRRLEADARLRQQRLILFSRGPISRGFIEWRETNRLQEIKINRIQSARAFIIQRHEILGTTGSPAYKTDLERLDNRLRTEQHQVTTRMKAAWVRDPRVRLLQALMNRPQEHASLLERFALSRRALMERFESRQANLEARHSKATEALSKKYGEWESSPRYLADQKSLDERYARQRAKPRKKAKGAKPRHASMKAVNRKGVRVVGWVTKPQGHKAGPKALHGVRTLRPDAREALGRVRQVLRTSPGRGRVLSQVKGVQRAAKNVGVTAGRATPRERYILARCLVRARIEARLAAIEARHVKATQILREKYAGWEDSPRYQASQKALDEHFSRQKVDGVKSHHASLSAHWKSRQASLKAVNRKTVRSAGQAAKAQGRRIAQRTGRSLRGLGQLAKEAFDRFRQELKQPSGQDRVLAQTKGAQDAVRGIGAAAAKAALKTAAKATKGAIRTTGKATYYSGKAAGRVAIGAILALPTGGISLKVALQGAKEDLATGARETGKEAFQGAKQTGSEAAKGVASTGKAVAKGGAAMGKRLLPKSLQATAQTAVEAAKTSAGMALKALRLDLKGAAVTATLGTAKTAKAASGAVLKAAQLPAALRLPVAVAEKLPVIGTIVSVAKTTTEITLGATTSFEL